MVRRLQLLEPEHRPLVQRVAAMVGRVREGLLRDNKVIPPVLAVLALLIFAWLVAGALIGGDPDEEEGQQASKGESLSEAPGEDLDGGSPETPAPGAESRDADSFAAFEPKDPFRELIPKAGGDDNESTNGGDRNGDRDGDGSKTGDGKAKSKGDGKAKSKAKSEDKSKAGESKAREDEDFIEQSFPEESGDLAGGGNGDTGGEDSGGGSGRDGGAGRGGNGGLFDSGGNLALP